MQVLLVGGKNDGKRVDVGSPVPPYFKVPVMPEMAVDVFDSLPDETGYIQVEDYEAMQLCGTDKGNVHKFTVYGIRGLNHIDLIAMLIHGYRS